jgi:hypothetical protein
MSGPADLARLTETIDLANELLLSPEIKMLDVGDGVNRPTNAMVMSGLATQLGGAMPYATVGEGIAGTVSGTNFSVLSSVDDEYVKLYRNEAGAPVLLDEYPNAKATRTARDFAESAYDLTFPQSLAEEMPWAILDKYFRAILGVKSNGAVHAILDRLPGLDLVGDYVWAITDANNVVLLGIKWSGEVVLFGQASEGVTAFADGPIGGQDIWALVFGVPYQITSTGDNFSPVVNSGRVTYISRHGGVSQQVVDLPVAGSVAPFVNTLLHFVCGGQSLSMGATSLVTTTQPPTANRLFTLQDGVRLTNQDDTLAPAMVAPFKPLVAKTNEVPAVQLSAQLNRIRALPSNAGVLTSVHGRGGYAIAALSKGTLPYTNSITAVTAAKAEATRLAFGYRVPFVDWIQGENDANKAAGLYLAALLQLQTDYDADIRAISGQSQVVPLLLDQISNWTAYNLTTSFVPLEQLQAALTYPDRFYCAGPKYWLQTAVDGIHLAAENSMRLGAMHARAAEAIINGNSWKPTHAVSAVRVGAVVTLRFHTPAGPLTVDTVNVSNPGNLGIRYVDDTASASVQGVKLVGNNTVEVTLSAVPSGANPYIGIADVGTSGAAGGPVTGPRACLRDNSPDLDGYGRPLFNWACHQRINVQTA